MNVSDYLSDIIKDSTRREINIKTYKKIVEMIKRSDKDIWNSMEDLFGNLFTNIQLLLLHIEGGIAEPLNEKFKEELAQNIGIILSVKEVFTGAKKGKLDIKTENKEN
jgi:predicted house-cleaning noncanonical NTP pyrophosphatase (MazG superfamily)